MSLVARVAILKLIMGMVKINKHSEQRIAWRINGKHAALSWKNSLTEWLHSPLSPLPTPAQNNRKGWTLATHGSKCRRYVYSLQHENLLLFSSILFYRWLLFSQFATYNALQLTSIHQFNWNIGRRELQFCCFLRCCRCRYLSYLISH